MCCFVLSMSCVCGNQRFCISHFAASAFPVKLEASSFEKEEEGGKQVGEWGMLEGAPRKGKGRAGQEPFWWPWGESIPLPFPRLESCPSSLSQGPLAPFDARSIACLFLISILTSFFE